MKNKIKIICFAIFLSLLSISGYSQNTALSGTGSNGCSAGNAGTDNTTVGCYAGTSLLGTSPSSGYNVLIGFRAGNSLTHEVHNTFVGYKSGYNCGLNYAEASDWYNCSFGSESGYNNV